MKGTILRRIGWAGALVLAGISIGPIVHAQEASPTAEPATVQTAQPAQQEESNAVPWSLLGLLGVLGLGGLVRLRPRDEPESIPEGSAKT